jgi:hypothetical protein
MAHCADIKDSLFSQVDLTKCSLKISDQTGYSCFWKSIDPSRRFAPTSLWITATKG